MLVRLDTGNRHAVLKFVGVWVLWVSAAASERADRIIQAVRADYGQLY